jgi:hypothetical protein
MPHARGTETEVLFRINPAPPDIPFGQSDAILKVQQTRLIVNNKVLGLWIQPIVVRGYRSLRADAPFIASYHLAIIRKKSGVPQTMNVRPSAGETAPKSHNFDSNSIASDKD